MPSDAPPPARDRAIGPVGVRRLGCLLMIVGAMLAAALPGLLAFIAIAGFGWGGPALSQDYSGSTGDTIFIVAMLAAVVAIGVTAMLAGYAYYRTGVARARYHRPMLVSAFLLSLVGLAARLFVAS